MAATGGDGGGVTGREGLSQMARTPTRGCLPAGPARCAAERQCERPHSRGGCAARAHAHRRATRRVARVAQACGRDARTTRHACASHVTRRGARAAASAWRISRCPPHRARPRPLARAGARQRTYWLITRMEMRGSFVNLLKASSICACEVSARPRSRRAQAKPRKARAAAFSAAPRTSNEAVRPRSRARLDARARARARALASTTRKLELRFSSTLPQPASSMPVIVSSSPIMASRPLLLPLKTAFSGLQRTDASVQRAQRASRARVSHRTGLRPRPRRSSLACGAREGTHMAADFAGPQAPWQANARGVTRRDGERYV